MISVDTVLTPHGFLRLDQAEDEFSLEDGLGERLERCFTRGSGHGLLQLGAGEAGTSLPSSLAWWRDFAIRFVPDLCALGETAEADERAPFHFVELATWIQPWLAYCHDRLQGRFARAIRVSQFADSIDFLELCPSLLKSRYRHFASASGQGREESI